MVGFRLSKQRHDELIDMLTPYMRRAEPTAFSCEGPSRHRLRSKLCLKGWRWDHADQEAHAVVHGALQAVGAKRPLWIEGQMNYCSSGFLRDENCWNCGSPLPDHAKRYCCWSCRRAVTSLHGMSYEGR